MTEIKDDPAKVEFALNCARHCLSLEGMAKCMLMYGLKGRLATWAQDYLKYTDPKMREIMDKQLPADIDAIWQSKKARAACPNYTSYWDQGNKDISS